MKNEEFQSIVLDKLETLENGVKRLENRQTNIENKQTNIENGVKNLEDGQIKLENEIVTLKIRQDEIFQVVTAIEHSNQIGRAELDSQNFRVAKLEGKFINVGNVCFEEDKVANL